MLALIIAGEALFILPFHLMRFFRPSVLEVFGLSNTELGVIQAAYGVVAMLAYFPGGLLADQFSARKLLAYGLWFTAAGGLYLATFPGYPGAVLLWSFFGVTSILLSWAALIRAARDWGGSSAQGRAFGLLDGGRGALAALLASLAALSFTLAFPEGYDAADFEQRKQALRLVIHGYTLATFAAGVLVWFALPESQSHIPGRAERSQRNRMLWSNIKTVLRLPPVWLTAIIVVCAYVAYRGSENFSLYAVEVFAWSEPDAAGLTAAGAWLRPVAAIGFGLLGDRYLVSRMTIVCFVLLLATQLMFVWLSPAPSLGWVMVTNLLLSSCAIFGLRALYFALLEEAKVPLAVTGTAVGLISVLGYTPDIFVAFVGGVLLDASPGVTGHQHYFAFQAAFSALGLTAGIVFYKRYRSES